MKLTSTLKAQIEADIKKCEEHASRDGSEELYVELVAKYSVLDAEFEKNLSNGGKAAALGSALDFRMELRAIAAKLRMYLLIGEEQSHSNPLKVRVDEFIERGNKIKKEEFHPAKGGFPFECVSGPLYDVWMSEINIFNERYLKTHPLHKSIYSTYFHRNNNPSAFDDMMGYMHALAADEEYFKTGDQKEEKTVMYSRKTIEELLSEDIYRCQQFLCSPTDIDMGKDLYVEITGRYDSVIKGFGNGLYQYIDEMHFYDPEISEETLMHNMKVLLNKMITYQAVNYPPTSKPATNIEKSEISNRVFIVHGHDDAAIQEMARTLEKCDLEAIILREQPDDGLTIIEKIEQYSDVDFAVVLYTQCDVGRAKNTLPEHEKYRARQNVVFEHGYLIGRLGRENVCALVKGDVETPGDISGVVYVPMDELGAWKVRLARNMKSVGIDVDMNKFCN